MIDEVHIWTGPQGQAQRVEYHLYRGDRTVVVEINAARVVVNHGPRQVPEVALTLYAKPIYHDDDEAA